MWLSGCRCRTRSQGASFPKRSVIMYVHVVQSSVTAIGGRWEEVWEAAWDAARAWPPPGVRPSAVP